jgi:hypothetical protein
MISPDMVNFFGHGSVYWDISIYGWIAPYMVGYDRVFYDISRYGRVYWDIFRYGSVDCKKQLEGFSHL